MVSLYMVLIVVFIILLTHRQFKWYQHVQKYKEFYKCPGPFYAPILGSTYLMFRKNILNFMQMFHDVYGKSCIVYMPHRTYLTIDPEEIKIILNQAIDKSNEYNHLQEVFDNSLLLCKAPIWKPNRKLISKSFQQNILEMFVPTFYEKSQILVDVLKNKEFDDIIYCFEKYTLDVFCEATVGIKSSILKTKKSYLVDNITSGQKLMFGRIGNVIKMNNFLFSFLPDSKQIKKIVNSSNNFFQNIIRVKRSYMNSKNKEVGLSSRGLPVLDLLLQVADHKHLKDDYIINEMLLFGAAATDTTAYTLAYYFCLMAINSDVQENVYEEIMSVVGKDEEIDMNHINQLKYTEMSLNESMRLLPSIPMIGRQATCDIDLGTKVIPKDTGIVVNFLALHRDKNIYANPLVYDPDRFLPENVKKRHPYSFLPFSGGPRNCIGWKYAQMLMKTTIANVVRNFRIETKYKSIDEMNLISSVVMMPSDPIDISFIPRN